MDTKTERDRMISVIKRRLKELIDRSREIEQGIAAIINGDVRTSTVQIADEDAIQQGSVRHIVESTGIDIEQH